LNRQINNKVGRLWKALYGRLEKVKKEFRNKKSRLTKGYTKGYGIDY